MAAKSSSARVKEQNARRVLDTAARERRARKALETLEQDNRDGNLPMSSFKLGVE